MPLVHTFHLARPGVLKVLRSLWAPPRKEIVPGLLHAECLTPKQLGASVFSPSRWKLHQLAMFAAWEDESAIDAYLASSDLGRALARGWHVRLRFRRRWGEISEFSGLPLVTGPDAPEAPVVAVTLARLRLPEAVRFVRWGKPVERLVRDHPGVTLALAAARPLRTLSTFSVWKSERQMIEMVHGVSDSGSEHAHAMAERRRRDFHQEFTTLRFDCLSEHGTWEGRNSIVPR